MKAISLFTGAGGLDLGLEKAGFTTSVAVERDDDCVATLRENRDWPVIQDNVHNISSTDILDVGGLKEGEAALLAAGPPCQPFSKSAYWSSGDTERLDDPRSSTLEQFLVVLRYTKPEAFILENVPGLGYKNKDEGLQKLRRVVEDINNEIGTDYYPTIGTLNSVAFGVPQERRRLFIVAHRDGRDFSFPAPSHVSAEEWKDGCGKRHYRTAWDALADIEEAPDNPELQVTGKWAELLPSIPEGENYLFHTERGEGKPLFGWRRRFWNFLLKLAKDQPSWTITAQPGSATGPFHWHNRRLSRRELCRLQTFPDGYDVVGNVRSAQRQIGNAVPAALAERLGWEIRVQLLDNDTSVPDSMTLVPKRRLPVPDPEKPADVPPQYDERVGEHDPHPGEGKGPGARAAAAGG